MHIDDEADDARNPFVDEETVSEEQMCDLIDLVVAELREIPKWQLMSPEAAERTITQLKAKYNQNARATHTPAEAVALMELTGRKLGEALGPSIRHSTEVAG